MDITKQNEVRKRLKRLIADFPVKISGISREIGLNDKQARYVLQGFIKHSDNFLYPNTLDALDQYLISKGY